MDDPFYEELCAWGGVEGAPKLEDPGVNCPALVREHAVRPCNFGAERFPDLSEGRLARLNHLTRQIVGIHDQNPAITEELGRGGLSHANATS